MNPRDASARRSWDCAEGAVTPAVAPRRQNGWVTVWAERSGEDVEGRTVAAVDLGSNSFHMVVARWTGGAFHVVDRLRERVRLAEGLDRKRRLSDEVSERAIACLEQFGQRLSEMKPQNVRVVGTNTLRQLRDDDGFLARAEAALGHEIDVVAGLEEARLIYMGVAHDVALEASERPARRLVLDIGGGSTESILGAGLEILESDSLYMGCVTYSQRYFEGGRLSKRRMERARLAAALELDPIRRRYRGVGWEEAIGCSGTIQAIGRIHEACGWSSERVTAKGLRKLRRLLQGAEHVDRLDVPGLSEDRAPVIAGGVAILQALFDALKLDELQTSESALREGVLHDLLGRIRDEDQRDATIRRLQERYEVDVDHAARVERLALTCLGHVAADWGLGRPTCEQLLAWAARVHEIGLSVARPGYQRHGAYLVANSNLPGFSREDQRMLASIVRGHRRRVRDEYFAELTPERSREARRLCVLLRLARRLNRSRSPTTDIACTFESGPDSITLRFDEGWLDEHSLTRADLEDEANRVADAGIELVIA